MSFDGPFPLDLELIQTNRKFFLTLATTAESTDKGNSCTAKGLGWLASVVLKVKCKMAMTTLYARQGKRHRCV